MQIPGIPLNFDTPEVLEGTSGTYTLCGKSKDDNKLYVQLGVRPCLGRKDGTTYNAVGLMVRFLYSGDDPKLPENFEARDKRPYKKASNGDEVYAQQLNKLIFPVASVNIGSAHLMEALSFHLEALYELMLPFYEANSLEPVEGATLMTIFEAQNPQMLMPVINFEPPKKMPSWAESLEAMQQASKAGYTPKNADYKNSGDPEA